MTILYKMKLQAEEEGLTVRTEEWVSIHETPCFHFCVIKARESLVQNALKHTGETPLQAAKRLNYLKRISKVNSRFAFTTKEKALEHLRFMKKRQRDHMARETAFINAFLESEQLEENRYISCQLVPDSRDIVRKYLRFD